MTDLTDCFSTKYSLAPRTGLEPGTCGLTAQITEGIIAENLKIPKKYFLGVGIEIFHPNLSRT